MCRFEIFVGVAIACSLSLAPASAQAPAATSDGATGKVLDIQGKVLDIVGLGGNAQGASSPITGQVMSLGAAIQALKDSGTGIAVTETPKPPALQSKATPKREVKIYLPADVLFDFDKADLLPEAGPVLERVATVLKTDPNASATVEGTQTARAAISTISPFRSAARSRYASGSSPTE